MIFSKAFRMLTIAETKEKNLTLRFPKYWKNSRLSKVLIWVKKMISWKTYCLRMDIIQKRQVVRWKIR